jgi:hypothetical protein
LADREGARTRQRRNYYRAYVYLYSRLRLSVSRASYAAATNTACTATATATPPQPPLSPPMHYYRGKKGTSVLGESIRLYICRVEEYTSIVIIYARVLLSIGAYMCKYTTE